MTEAMTTATMTTRSPLPPFTRESAIQKVRGVWRVRSLWQSSLAAYA